MGTTFCQVPMVQDNEVADVVCQKNPPLAGCIIQDCRVIQALLLDVVNADGIHPVPPQFRGQVGIHILVNEEGYADWASFP